MRLTRYRRGVAALALIVVSISAAQAGEWYFDQASSSVELAAKIRPNLVEGWSAVRYAPPVYNDDFFVASTLWDHGSAYRLSAGALTANLASDVNGGPGSGRRTSASIRIEDGDLVVGDPNGSFFTLTFEAIENSVFLEGGDPETFVPDWQRTLVYDNVDMTFMGAPVSLPTNPGYGTVVISHDFVSGGWFRVAMNWTLPSGSSAIRVSMLNCPTPGGTLTGDIDIGWAFADMSSVVPEPSTFVVLGGLGVFALSRRRFAKR